MMIISKGYAKRLIRRGKASEGVIVKHNGAIYKSVDRHDLQRVDHYWLSAA